MRRIEGIEGGAAARGGRPAEPLDPGSVLVWRVALDRSAAATAALRSVLSADERARADRFHFEADRARYTVAHAALRRVLARHTGVPAERLRFETNEYGKPSLAGARGVRFNLSHSHALALVAVSLGRELGVDVERVRPEIDCLEIAESYFSARERAALAAFPASQRVHGFYACWTRKEAFIKAIGRGLSEALDSFDVSIEPGPRAALLRCAGGAAEALRWRMRGLAPAPGYVGALAAERGDWVLEERDWE
jgi:4'-phosphopantetheinyl transferase